jgi:hypothetical protein
MLAMVIGCMGMQVSARDNNKEGISRGIQSTVASSATGVSSISETSASTASSGKYYSQLSGNAKQIYSALAKKNWKKATSVTISLKTKRAYTAAGETALYKEVLRGYWSYLRDHPEVYWINAFTIYYKYKSGSIYQIVIQPQLYYSGIVSDDSKVQSAIRSAVSAIKKKRSSKSRYDTVKAIHDYVAGKITYGNQYYVIPQEHTLTGALLSKYDNTAVCEGYAKLFKVLCDKFNIPCLIVLEDGNHMWNYVKMDNNKWYLVDVTWDDSTSGYSHKYFLVGRSALSDHNPVNTYSTTNGVYAKLQVPSLATSKYKKSSKK